MANLKSQKSDSQNPNSKVSPARLAAFEILRKIENEKAFSAILLPAYEEKLEAKDRALCHEITLGVLRRQIYLDKIAQSLIKTKIGKFDIEVLIALRIGVYQLIFLDKIPSYSAINESVNLVKLAKKKSASGLVNAVLRKIGQSFSIQNNIIPNTSDNEKANINEFINTVDKNSSGKDFGEAENHPSIENLNSIEDKLENLSIKTSHPRWLLENWVRQFGFEATEKIAFSNNETPALVFRLTEKSDEKTIEILRKLNLKITESSIVPGAWRVSKAGEFLLAFAAAGKIYFQEESSQLVGRALNLKTGEKFLDVCAAPGSKTTLAAMQNAQFKTPDNKSDLFVAGDKYLHRLRVLRETCERVGARGVQLVAYDAENALPFESESFNCILVDAPCSGTGTIRHNPEIRYFVAPEDFRELSAKQLRILENASKLSARGGRLIYSTCSLETAENEAVIGKFLAHNPEFIKVQPKLPQQFLTEDGFARTFPHRDACDAFFIAYLERN